MRRAIVFCLLAGLVIAARPLEGRQPAAGLHAALDRMLDLYVRDGLVYYNAIRSERNRLDGYLASLDGPSARNVDQWERNDQIAFWLNAYDAWVLKAVVDHFPIRGRADAYPSNSIRQIPGVFDKTGRRVAGRTLTLDEIEKSVLAGFNDPRLFLAIGRGAVGSGRLRSEAYVGDRLEAQLTAVEEEFTTGGRLLHIDEASGVVSVTPILSWREAEFVNAYAAGAPPRYAQRSPIERALLAFIDPHLLTHEREFLEPNNFRVEFMPFDWRLNEL
jgi:hypothetical protein